MTAGGVVLIVEDERIERRLLGAIVERTSDWAGAHRCYVRQRQQGAVVGTGMTRLGTLDVTIHINNGQVTGVLNTPIVIKPGNIFGYNLSSFFQITQK